MCLEQSALAHFIRCCKHYKQAQGHKRHKLKHGVSVGADVSGLRCGKSFELNMLRKGTFDRP